MMKKMKKMFVTMAVFALAFVCGGTACAAETEFDRAEYMKK